MGKTHTDGHFACQAGECVLTQEVRRKATGLCRRPDNCVCLEVRWEVIIIILAGGKESPYEDGIHEVSTLFTDIYRASAVWKPWNGSGVGVRDPQWSPRWHTF